MIGVYLNVGGVFYLTSRETLEKQDNYFRALSISNKDIEQDSAIFIDRDPSNFRYVLNWLRGVKTLPDDKYFLYELLYEADYYCMEDMKEFIMNSIKSSTTIQSELQEISKQLRLTIK